SLTSVSTTLMLPLDQTPSPGQMISGTIAEVNPAGDTTFGPGGTSQIYRFQGWLPPSGPATLDLTSTSGSSVVTSATYSPGSPASLTFTLSSPINSANALTVNVSYSTAASTYLFEPA